MPALTVGATSQQARRVRSFVVRDRRRLSAAQARVVRELWPVLAVDLQPRPLDLCALFSRHAPLTVEIGTGRGDLAVQHATQHPEENYLLLETNRFCLAQLLVGIRRNNLCNIRFVNDDATLVFRHQLPVASIDTIWVFFPDPWPKRRHHKRRLLQADFLSCVASRLRPNGRLFIATDWADYARHISTLVADSGQLCGLADTRGLTPRPAWRVATRYEQRCQARTVFNFCLVRTHGSVMQAIP